MNFWTWNMLSLYSNQFLCHLSIYAVSVWHKYFVLSRCANSIDNMTNCVSAFSFCISLTFKTFALTVTGRPDFSGCLNDSGASQEFLCHPTNYLIRYLIWPINSANSVITKYVLCKILYKSNHFYNTGQRLALLKWL